MIDLKPDKVVLDLVSRKTRGQAVSATKSRLTRLNGMVAFRKNTSTGRNGAKGVKMKVTTYCINKGRPSQYFGLKNARSGDVLYSAPNNWKTEKGALNWAIKHGFKVSKK